MKNVSSCDMHGSFIKIKVIYYRYGGVICQSF